MENSPVLEKITANVPKLCEAAERAQIWDETSYNEAADLTKFLSESVKTVESERKRITKPMNDSLKAANAFFAKASEPLERAVTIIKGKILEYKKKEERFAEQARLEAEKKRKELEPEPVAPVVTPTIARGTFGTVSTQKRWTFEVKDLEAVPAQYITKTVNSQAVRTAISDGVREITGLQIYEVESAVVR